MNRKRKDRRSLALALLLAAGLLLPVAVSSQGLFKRGGVTDENHYGYGGTAEQTTGLFGNRSGGATLANESFGAAGSVINNEPFGAPIGGGIAILLAAGAGYALIQSKKNKQN